MNGESVTAIEGSVATGTWAGPGAGATPDGSFHLELEGWAGPLDLLLDLARRQKVDLRAISILELVDQYLDYIRRADTLRLELAADYLVMAAWLAYLKSALLLPKAEQEDSDPEELALRLQLRLRRLGAMREAAARLMTRDRQGRDVFLRASPEGLRTDRKTLWRVHWFDLVHAYGTVRARTDPVVHTVRRRPIVSLETALARLSDLAGQSVDWKALSSFLPDHADPRLGRSSLASHFAAALELAKEGRVELSQDVAYGSLRLRAASRS